MIGVLNGLLFMEFFKLCYEWMDVFIMDEFCVDLEWMFFVFFVFGNGNFGELY